MAQGSRAETAAKHLAEEQSGKIQEEEEGRLKTEGILTDVACKYNKEPITIGEISRVKK